jgi:hypothetical protein
MALPVSPSRTQAEPPSYKTPPTRRSRTCQPTRWSSSRQTTRYVPMGSRRYWSAWSRATSICPRFATKCRSKPLKRQRCRPRLAARMKSIALSLPGWSRVIRGCHAVRTQRSSGMGTLVCASDPRGTQCPDEKLAVFARRRGHPTVADMYERRMDEVETDVKARHDRACSRGRAGLISASEAWPC